MFELEQVCNENLIHYNEYEKAFETDLKQYQSRIYPSENAEILRWYHIKADKKYIGAVWLAVSKEYRRKGIGTKLLKTAEQWAKENDIEVILLNSGLPREDAHAFYESQGYFKKSYGFIKRV